MMTAAVLIEQNKPLVLLNNILIPTLKRGQVLVKILFAGLCHSQLMEISGLRGEDKYLPHLLGHEGVGTVVEVGEGVTKIKKNDTVVLGWIKGDGLDGGASQYHTQDGLIINSGAVTTFSDYAIISENRLTKKPIHTPDELAVLYGCAIPTGLGMVLNAVPEKFTGTVGFVGLGGIGLSALLSSKLRHFEKIIAIDINAEKLLLAKELGATHVINPANQNTQDEIKKLTNNVGVDFCFESAGSCKTIELAFEITKRLGGKCIFASHPPAHEKISLDPFELICGKHICGTWGGDSVPDQDIRKFNDYYHKKLLPLEKLISKKYLLEDINQAVEDLKDKKIARALIRCCDDLILSLK
ncbi:MAG: acetoin dehydrogenase [Gammaproteobacteria bacterium RIFCSPHIGHO2_12_FULL_36_30]|nr:MAG: acetoin dehydrogenase [Gammaproteobacteria bacterium RIFCSPHIGHO2_12_FULL_36_30]